MSSPQADRIADLDERYGRHAVIFRVPWDERHNFFAAWKRGRFPHPFRGASWVGTRYEMRTTMHRFQEGVAECTWVEITVWFAWVGDGPAPAASNE